MFVEALEERVVDLYVEDLVIQVTLGIIRELPAE